MSLPVRPPAAGAGRAAGVSDTCWAGPHATRCTPSLVTATGLAALLFGGSTDLAAQAWPRPRDAAPGESVAEWPQARRLESAGRRSVSSGRHRGGCPCASSPRPEALLAASTWLPSLFPMCLLLTPLPRPP